LPAKWQTHVFSGLLQICFEDPAPSRKTQARKLSISSGAEDPTLVRLANRSSIRYR
jgi:hypothetical protein